MVTATADQYQLLLWAGWQGAYVLNASRPGLQLLKPWPPLHPSQFPCATSPSCAPEQAAQMSYRTPTLQSMHSLVYGQAEYESWLGKLIHEDAHTFDPDPATCASESSCRTMTQTSGKV